jgi:PAS domain S-box-containing protein
MAIGARPGQAVPPPSAAAGRRDHSGTAPGAARYRMLFDAIDQGFCIVEMLLDADGLPGDYRFLEVNAAFAEQTGLRDAVGRTMRELRADHEPHWFEIYGRVALTGEPVRFEREAAALGRWYDVYAFRVDAPEQLRVAILFRDITAQKRSDDRIRLLAADADHRAKNVLAVVAGMVRLTRAGSIKDFRDDLLGRIHALAHSQRILSEESWRGAELGRLVADGMAPHRAAGRVTCGGPAVMLAPDAVQPVAMALHELATNAAKYGALSAPEGRVAIAWSLHAGAVVIGWCESGGPPVAPPTRKGLGTTVVTMSIRDQLGGEVGFDWRRDGLVCTMTVPAASTR